MRVQSVITFWSLFTISVLVKNTKAEKPHSDKICCIYKCCNGTQIYNEENKCVVVPKNFTNQSLDFHELKIYKNDVRTKKELLNTTVDDLFRIVAKSSLININASGSEYYVTEDGKLTTHHPNRFRRWKNYDFCLVYSKHNENELTMEVFFTSDDDDPPESYPSESRTLYTAAGQIISCIFMFAVLVVYALLPELRNLQGLISIATVFTTFCAFVNFSVENLMPNENMSMAHCIGSSVTRYFLYLAIFCWLTVHSYTAFKVVTKRIVVQRLSRDVKWRKFGKCCAFGWGVPFLMTVFVEVMDNLDLTDYPWIIQPRLASDKDEQGCFFSSLSDTEHEKLLYLYIPMMVLISANILLSSVTAYNMRNTKNINQQINAVRGTPTSVNRKYFFVYLQLTVATGVSWIFEAVINYIPREYEWFKYIVDTYNMLFGVIIFFMFVCKNRIWKMLKKKYLKVLTGKKSTNNENSSCTTFSSSKTNAVELSDYNT